MEAIIHILSKFFITNWCTRELFLKSIKIYIKITIAPICFGVITIIWEPTMYKARTMLPAGSIVDALHHKL